MSTPDIPNYCLLQLELFDSFLLLILFLFLSFSVRAIFTLWLLVMEFFLKKKNNCKLISRIWSLNNLHLKAESTKLLEVVTSESHTFSIPTYGSIVKYHFYSKILFFSTNIDTIFFSFSVQLIENEFACFFLVEKCHYSLLIFKLNLFCFSFFFHSLASQLSTQ